MNRSDKLSKARKQARNAANKATGLAHSYLIDKAERLSILYYRAYANEQRFATR